MADQNDNSITGSVLLYSTPEPLDPVRHAKLGLRRSDRPFSFAAAQNFFPLQVGEFGAASTNYPIIFVGEAYTPVAVVGLRTGENLYIDETGAYRVGCYIPSYVRRYPFVGARDDQQQRTVVCIDRVFAMWTEDQPDVLLFENGEPSQFTKSCIEFCSQFEQDRARTEAFVELLKSLDLFESKQVNYTPRDADGTAGQPMLVAEHFAVSDVKLNALPAAKLAELRDSGALVQIYAHINSLYGWDRLIFESLARADSAGMAVGVVAGNA
jgi:hypothetical protein